MWLSTLAGNANFYFNQVGRKPLSKTIPNYLNIHLVFVSLMKILQVWLCTVGFGNILIDGIVSAMRIKSAEGLLLEHQPT